jgi:hypothetical protein
LVLAGSVLESWPGREKFPELRKPVGRNKKTKPIL